MNLVDRIRQEWQKNYIIIEIRSESYNKKELKQYSSYVKETLQKKFPDLDILSFRWSTELEIHWSLFLAVHNIKASGYRIKVASDIDAPSLKEECMNLETQGNKRVSDIDIYVRDKNACGGFKKISRKESALIN